MRDEQSLHLIQRGGCECDQKPPLVCGSQSTALSRDERGEASANGFKISLGATWYASQCDVVFKPWQLRHCRRMIIADRLAPGTSPAGGLPIQNRLRP
ncbi:MAG: hypothetical protein CM15mP84_09560 [Cellvibrionales bacterium]|nr:MAG: hypothetical protein CM15mP84_09560 [Cellvibrionales bacterium]